MQESSKPASVVLSHYQEKIPAHSFFKSSSNPWLHSQVLSHLTYFRANPILAHESSKPASVVLSASYSHFKHFRADLILGHRSFESILVVLSYFGVHLLVLSNIIFVDAHRSSQLGF